MLTAGLGANRRSKSRTGERCSPHVPPWGFSLGDDALISLASCSVGFLKPGQALGGPNVVKLLCGDEAREASIEQRREDFTLQRDLPVGRDVIQETPVKRVNPGVQELRRGPTPLFLERRD